MIQKAKHNFTIGHTHEQHPQKVNVDLFALADTRGLITASSGMGKSWLMRLIAERVSSQIQTLIIDPEGEFPTLREDLDILVVSESGDVKPDIRSAGLLARRLIETGVSAVLDIYDLPGDGDPWDKRRLFVYAFLNGLMSIPKKLYHPMLVMIDEAHQFAPEAPTKSGDLLSLHYFKQRISTSLLSRSAVRSVQSAGRKRGIGGVLATQRLSKIDKDSIADCRNYFIGGTSLDNDRERAADILGMNKAERMGLRDLDPGTFFCFGPAINAKGVSVFSSDMVRTTHPQAGQQREVVVPSASAHIAQIAAQLAEIPAEAKAEIETMDQMKNEISKLKRDLAARPVQVQETPQEPINIEVPVFSDEQYRDLANIFKKYDEKAEALHQEVKIFSDKANADIVQLIAALVEPSRTLEEIRKSVNGYKHIQAPSPARPAITYSQRESVQHKTTTTPQGPYNSGGSLTGPEQKIVDALAWLASIGQTQPIKKAVAILAGYVPGAGGFTGPCGSLKRENYIDYAPGTRMYLTQKGIDIANHPGKALTQADIQNQVMSILDGPKKRILIPLLKAWPESMDKNELAKAAGYVPGTGGFTGPIGKLHTTGIVDYTGKNQAKAADFLFLQA